VISAVALVGASAGGCDDQSDLPADLVQQQSDQQATDQQNAAATRPTTQELVRGERVWINLDTLPLRLRAPSSWRITRHGSAGSNVWLEGATLHGDVQIDLTQRPAVARREYELFLKGIQRRIDSPSGREAIQLGQVGPMQIVDYREELPAAPKPVVDESGNPKLDASGELVMQTAVPMRWRRSIYVPRADHAELYELRFVVLTKDQYEADREFLEQIFASLQYVGTTDGAAPPSTGPATEPAQPR
jgi:hypothetical protein